MPSETPVSMAEINKGDQRVSVIMPVFNAQDTLDQSVISVLDQSHRDLELLIIDDGSSDQSRVLIQKWVVSDPRVRLIALKKNSGVAAARNAGISQAAGRFIAFLDADDVWLPQKLQKQLERMRAMNAAACITSYFRFREYGDWLGIVKAPDSLDYDRLLHGNAVGNLTGLYDRLRLGKILQQTIPHEDYLMWLEVAQRAGRIVSVPEPLAAYRVASHSLSGNKLRSACWTWEIYRHHLGLSLLYSAYLMMHYVGRAIFKRL